MSNFRSQIPANTCTATYSDYRRYKIPWLRDDFYKRCGYCNDHDSWSGGRRGMQIDHFVPKAKFASVFPVHAYSNLIYSCFYCNNHKSDDWVTTDPHQPIALDAQSGYIHPRDPVYDTAFERTTDGRIVPKNAVADYMFKVLCLGLRRHRLIHHLELLWQVWNEVKDEIDNLNISYTDRVVLDNRKKEISDEFMEIYKDFRLSLDD